MELLTNFWRDVCEVPPIVLYVFFGGSFLIVFLFLFGSLFLRKPCSHCGIVEDPNEMFWEADGSFLCRSCKAEKIAALIVSGCEQCH
jgi:hypothetical protein